MKTNHRKERISKTKWENWIACVVSKLKSKISELDVDGPFAKGPYKKYRYSNYYEIYELLMSVRITGAHDPSLLTPMIALITLLAIPTSMVVVPNVWNWPVELFIFTFLAYFLVAVYVYFLIIIGIFALRDSRKEIPAISLRLLAGIKRPYLQDVQFGLTYKEIERIKRYAQVEQSSADWRGAIINIIVIGSVSAIIASFSLWIQFLFDTKEFTSLNDFLRPSSPDWLNIVTIIISAVLIICVSYKFLLYLLRFLAREPGNHTILLACEEAQSLLESFGLQNEETVDFEKRLLLVEHLGFEIIKPSSFHFFDMFFGPTFIGPDYHQWHIIPKSKLKIRNRLASRWVKLLKTMRSARAKKPHKG